MIRVRARTLPRVRPFLLVLPALLTAALSVSSAARSAEDSAVATDCGATRGAVSSLACALSQQLTPAARGATVTVVDLKTDTELPDPEALRERIQSAVARALDATERPATPSALRVELSLQKVAGTLRVTAELRRPTRLWQRVRRQKASAERRAFAEAALDAELRSLIPPPPLVARETLKTKAPERGVVALACGPVGSERAQELVIVTRSSVRVGRFVGGAFVERRRASWSGLSKVAPAPLREPIASADVTPDGRLRVGLSDRRDGLELDADLSVVRRFEGRLPVPGGGCSVREGLGFSANVTSCEASLVGSSESGVALDAIAGAAGFWVGRPLGGSTLLSSRATPFSAPTSGVGAQLSLGDADTDGDLELAFSADTLEPAKDELRVVSLRQGKLVRRFELRVPDVRAIAICSRRESAAMAPLVVATGDELWLVR